MSAGDLDFMVMNELNKMIKRLMESGLFIPPGKITFDQAGDDFRKVTICFRYREKDDGIEE